MPDSNLSAYLSTIIIAVHLQRQQSTLARCILWRASFRLHSRLFKRLIQWPS